MRRIVKRGTVLNALSIDTNPSMCYNRDTMDDITTNLTKGHNHEH